MLELGVASSAQLYATRIKYSPTVKCALAVFEESVAKSVADENVYRALCAQLPLGDRVVVYAQGAWQRLFPAPSSEQPLVMDLHRLPVAAAVAHLVVHMDMLQQLHAGVCDRCMCW